MGLTYRATLQATDAILVISQVLIGFGGAISVIASYIGVQGSVPHQDMAIATAVLNLWSSIGSSISIAISASVWNKQVLRTLRNTLVVLTTLLSLRLSLAPLMLPELLSLETWSSRVSLIIFILMSLVSID